MADVAESLVKGHSTSAKGVTSPSRLPLSPLQLNGRDHLPSTGSESPMSLGGLPSPSPEDDMGSEKRSEDLEGTPKGTSGHLSSDNFFHHGRDRARSTAVTAAEAKAVGLVSIASDETEEDVMTQNWNSHQSEANLDISQPASDDPEGGEPEELLPDVTLEIIERVARVEKQMEELNKRAAHSEDDMAETKTRATEFGQRMMKWREEQEVYNTQQQQVVATCIKQIVSLTSQLGGIAQPGFIDTISEQLAKGMTSEVLELRKELKNTQAQFEEFKMMTESKEKKRATEVQLQLDSFKDKLERKYPVKTLVDASLIPRLRHSTRPFSAKKPSRIPRLRGVLSPGIVSPGGMGMGMGGASPPPSVPPSPKPPSPKLLSNTRPKHVRNLSVSSLPSQPLNPMLHTPNTPATPVATTGPGSVLAGSASASVVTSGGNRGRRGSIERSQTTPIIQTPTPSYATPTTSSKRRSSVDRGTPAYSTPTNDRRSSSATKPPPPPLNRSVSVTPVAQTPARATPTGTRPTAQTPRARGSSIAAPPQSAESTRPRRVSLPAPNSNPTKTAPLVATSRVQAKPNNFISPS